MLGKLGGMLTEPPRVHVLQGARNLLMPADAPRGEYLFVQGLAEEGVGEAVEDGARTRALFENADPYRLFEGGEKGFFIDAEAGRCPRLSARGDGGVFRSS